MSTEDEFVDLDQEELYDSRGRRITAEYVAAAVDEVESDDVVLDETQAVFPQRGRPSLSSPGVHSPRVDTRVPSDVKRRLERLARVQHRAESEVVREALEEYLARH
ncbi:ribbon-helix-helix CopG family protein [Halopolyspora algeriensis]|uniref:Ribbon-helix-helix CopG family protein n=1 Tax=Halopolyspora algeriensis TaxID=1500506 RepID=A0A368VY81_9ACTN|nr:ribbon-helix-helix protein, CopG family [Halopolyspora algeriensis]RCW46277.1 ribbon-helix-helix CopG family protein [Halopolyspora algeriensis]TQM55679.1 ribbon-helix-helix CopG family protein [Halopolyspora algeriensis]